MRNIYLLLIAICSFSISLAQTGTVSGTVTEENGETVIQANIIVDVSKGLATITDFDGNYSFELPVGTHLILYRYIGKEDEIVEVTVTEGSQKTVNVVLKEKVELINTIVVSASKYEKKLSEETVSIEVVRSDLLESNNINDAVDGLTKVPGVTVADGQANIRGGSGWSYGAGSRVLVLYDDLPLLSAEGGDAKWSLVPMENLESMEVIKGAASSIYGSGALNGVINFRTGFAKSTPETKINIWNGVTHSPRDKREAWWYDKNQIPFETGLNFVHKRKYGRTDFVWHGQASMQRSHLEFAGFSNARFGQKFRFRPRKIEGLSLGVNVNMYRSLGANFFLWQGTDSLSRVPLNGTASKSQSTRIIIDPFISYYDDRGNNYHIKFRYFNAKNEAELGQSSVPINYYGEFQYNRYFTKLKFNIVAGLAGFADVVKPEKGNVGSLSGDNRRYNIAPYAQLEKKLFNEKLNLTVGMRYEYFRMKSISNDTTFTSDLNRPLFRFGANYEIAEYTFIRGSWGEGYRFPSIAESFVNLNLGGVGIFPNPQLQDEQGWYAELAVKQGFKLTDNFQGFVDWSFFGMRYSDMIEVNFGKFGLGDPTAPSLIEQLGFGFSFQNVGETLVLGSEFTVQGTGKIGKFPLTLLGGYTYTNPRSLNWEDELTLYNEVGEVLTSIPSNNGLTTYEGTSTSTKNVLKYRTNHVFTLDAQTSFKKMDFGASVQYRSFMESIDYAFVSDLFISFESQLGTEAFSALRSFREQYSGRGTTLLSLRLMYNFTENASLTLQGNNLLNLTYTDRPALPGQPLNFTARFSYKFLGEKK